MENKELNLQAIREFLQKDITPKELISDLGELYAEFTSAVMKVSYSENEPVTDDQLRAKYTIEQLLQLLVNVQKQNEGK